MKIDQVRFLIVLLADLLLGCDTFDPEAPSSFTTYITTVAGNGYDVAFDFLETNDAYILAGALGPQCDIVDAYMAQVDKENRAIINLKTFGESNQGVEENFFSLALIQGRFNAVGFSLLRGPPGSTTTLFCNRPPGDIDGKLFFGTFKVKGE